MDSYSVTSALLLGDTHDFGALRRVQRGCGIGIRKGDVEDLPFPVSATRGGEKQAVARNVDALADFFKRLGRIYRADVNLRGNFRALAVAAFYLNGLRCSFWFGGSNWRRAHPTPQNLAGAGRVRTIQRRPIRKTQLALAYIDVQARGGAGNSTLVSRGENSRRGELAVEISHGLAVA